MLPASGCGDSCAHAVGVNLAEGGKGRRNTLKFVLEPVAFLLELCN